MKFDSNGEHLWNYHIEGTGKSRTIIYFSEGPNYITTLWSISECNVVIQGNNYWFDEFTYVVINLDKETGEVISHKIQYNSDPLKYMLVYYTETFEEKDKIRILAFLKYESELFGLAETIESKNGTVFLEGKLSFLTKVINPEFQQLNFEILGNPVGADEILRIKHSIHDNLNFEIYDLNGLIYLSGSLTDYPESELNLSLLHSGAYVIRCYNKEGDSGSKIFIKN